MPRFGITLTLGVLAGLFVTCSLSSTADEPVGILSSPRWKAALVVITNNNTFDVCFKGAGKLSEDGVALKRIRLAASPASWRSVLANLAYVRIAWFRTVLVLWPPLRPLRPLRRGAPNRPRTVGAALCPHLRRATR